jgi:hypothetical protein
MEGSWLKHKGAMISIRSEEKATRRGLCHIPSSDSPHVQAEEHLEPSATALGCAVSGIDLVRFPWLVPDVEGESVYA